MNQIEKTGKALDQKISSLYTKAEFSKDADKAFHYLLGAEWRKSGENFSLIRDGFQSVLSAKAMKHLTEKYYSGEFRYQVDDYYDPKYQPSASHEPIAEFAEGEKSFAPAILRLTARESFEAAKNNPAITAAVALAFFMNPDLTTMLGLGYAGYQLYHQLG